MAVLIVFLLGVANFALHGAVLASGHALLGRTGWYARLAGGKATLILEFALLLAALLVVYYVAAAWAWGYAGYTALNALGAWLILGRRV